MSLLTAKLICLDAEGKHVSEYCAANESKFTIGYYTTCDVVLEAQDANLAKGVHCEIIRDACGRVTIENLSKEHPILVDGIKITGKRPLKHETNIEILGKQYIWVYPPSTSGSNEDTPVKQIGVPEQLPNSCPELKKKILKENRITFHNFTKKLPSGEEDNTTTLKTNTANVESSEDNSATSQEQPENSAVNVQGEEISRIKATPEAEHEMSNNGDTKLLNSTIDKLQDPTKDKKETETKLEMKEQLSTAACLSTNPQCAANFSSPATSSDVDEVSDTSMHQQDLSGESSKMRPDEIISIEKTPVTTNTSLSEISSADSVITVDSREDDSDSVIELSCSEVDETPSKGPSLKFTPKTTTVNRKSCTATPRRKTPVSLRKHALLASAKKQQKVPTPCGLQQSPATPNDNTCELRRQSLGRLQSLSFPRRYPKIKKEMSSSQAQSSASPKRALIMDKAKRRLLTSTPVPNSSSVASTSTSSNHDGTPLPRKRKDLNTSKRTPPTATSISNKLLAKARRSACDLPPKSARARALQYAASQSLKRRQSLYVHATINVSTTTFDNDIKVDEMDGDKEKEEHSSDELSRTFTIEDSSDEGKVDSDQKSKPKSDDAIVINDSTGTVDLGPVELNQDNSDTELLLSKIDQVLNKSDELKQQQEAELKSELAIKIETDSIITIESDSLATEVSTNKNEASDTDGMSWDGLETESDSEKLILSEMEGSPTTVQGNSKINTTEECKLASGKDEVQPQQEVESSSVQLQNTDDKVVNVEASLGEEKEQHETIEKTSDDKNKVEGVDENKEDKQKDSEVRRTEVVETMSDDINKVESEEEEQEVLREVEDLGLDIHCREDEKNQLEEGKEDLKESIQIPDLQEQQTENKTNSTDPSNTESLKESDQKEKEVTVELPPTSKSEPELIENVLDINEIVTVLKESELSRSALYRKEDNIPGTPHRSKMRRLSLTVSTPGVTPRLLSSELALEKLVEESNEKSNQEEEEEVLAVEEVEIQATPRRSVRRSSMTSMNNINKLTPTEVSFLNETDIQNTPRRSTRRLSTSSKNLIMSKTPNRPVTRRSSCSIAETSAAAALPLTPRRVTRRSQSIDDTANMSSSLIFNLKTPKKKSTALTPKKTPLVAVDETIGDMDVIVEEEDNEEASTEVATGEENKDLITKNDELKLPLTGEVVQESFCEPIGEPESDVVTSNINDENQEEGKPDDGEEETTSAQHGVTELPEDDENYGVEVTTQGLNKAIVVDDGDDDSEDAEKIDFHGMRELLKTPRGCSTPRLKGIREMMKTPKQCKSPKLSGIKELIETPVAAPSSSKSLLGALEKQSTSDVFSSRLNQTEDEGLDKFFKTPRGKNIMIPNDPASVVLQPNTIGDGVELVQSTECNLNATNASTHLGKLFDTPISTITRFGKCLRDVENDEEEEDHQEKTVTFDSSSMKVEVSASETPSRRNLSSEEAFDELVGSTSAFKTPTDKVYKRNADKSTRTHELSPFSASDVFSDLAKTDVQEWVEKVENFAPEEEEANADNSDDDEKDNNEASEVSLTTISETQDDQVDPLLQSKMSDKCLEINASSTSAAASVKSSAKIYLICNNDDTTAGSEKSINISTISSIRDPLTSTAFKPTTSTMANITKDLHLAEVKQKENISRPVTPAESDMSGIQLLDETSESVMEPLMVSYAESDVDNMVNVKETSKAEKSYNDTLEEVEPIYMQKAKCVTDEPKCLNETLKEEQLENKQEQEDSKVQVEDEVSLYQTKPANDQIKPQICKQSPNVFMDETVLDSEPTKTLDDSLIVNVNEESHLLRKEKSNIFDNSKQLDETVTQQDSLNATLEETLPAYMLKDQKLVVEPIKQTVEGELPPNALSANDTLEGSLIVSDSDEDEKHEEQNESNEKLTEDDSSKSNTIVTTTKEKTPDNHDDSKEVASESKNNVTSEVNNDVDDGEEIAKETKKSPKDSNVSEQESIIESEKIQEVTTSEIREVKIKIDENELKPVDDDRNKTQNDEIVELQATTSQVADENADKSEKVKINNEPLEIADPETPKDNNIDLDNVEAASENLSKSNKDEAEFDQAKETTIKDSTLVTMKNDNSEDNVDEKSKSRNEEDVIDDIINKQAESSSNEREIIEKTTTPEAAEITKDRSLFLELSTDDPTSPSKNKQQTVENVVELPSTSKDAVEFKEKSTVLIHKEKVSFVGQEAEDVVNAAVSAKETSLLETTYHHVSVGISKELSIQLSSSCVGAVSEKNQQKQSVDDIIVIDDDSEESTDNTTEYERNISNEKVSSSDKIDSNELEAVVISDIEAEESQEDGQKDANCDKNESNNQEAEVVGGIETKETQEDEEKVTSADKNDSSNDEAEIISGTETKETQEGVQIVSSSNKNESNHPEAIVVSKDEEPKNDDQIVSSSNKIDSNTAEAEVVSGIEFAGTQEDSQKDPSFNKNKSNKLEAEVVKDMETEETQEDGQEPNKPEAEVVGGIEAEETKEDDEKLPSAEKNKPNEPESEVLSDIEAEETQENGQSISSPDKNNSNKPVPELGGIEAEETKEDDEKVSSADKKEPNAPEVEEISDIEAGETQEDGQKISSPDKNESNKPEPEVAGEIEAEETKEDDEKVSSADKNEPNSPEVEEISDIEAGETQEDGQNISSPDKNESNKPAPEVAGGIEAEESKEDDEKVSSADKNEPNASESEVLEGTKAGETQEDGRNISSSDKNESNKTEAAEVIDGIEDEKTKEDEQVSSADKNESSAPEAEVISDIEAEETQEDGQELSSSDKNESNKPEGEVVGGIEAKEAKKDDEKDSSADKNKPNEPEAEVISDIEAEETQEDGEKLSRSDKNMSIASEEKVASGFKAEETKKDDQIYSSSNKNEPNASESEGVEGTEAEETREDGQKPAEVVGGIEADIIDLTEGKIEVIVNRRGRKKQMEDSAPSTPVQKEKSKRRVRRPSLKATDQAEEIEEAPEQAAAKIQMEDSAPSTPVQKEESKRRVRRPSLKATDQTEVIEEAPEQAAAKIHRTVRKPKDDTELASGSTNNRKPVKRTRKASTTTAVSSESVLDLQKKELPKIDTENVKDTPEPNDLEKTEDNTAKTPKRRKLHTTNRHRTPQPIEEENNSAEKPLENELEKTEDNTAKTPKRRKLHTTNRHRTPQPIEEENNSAEKPLENELEKTEDNTAKTPKRRNRHRTPQPIEEENISAEKPLENELEKTEDNTAKTPKRRNRYRTPQPIEEENNSAEKPLETTSVEVKVVPETSNKKPLRRGRKASAEAHVKDSAVLPEETGLVEKPIEPSETSNKVEEKDKPTKRRRKISSTLDSIEESPKKRTKVDKEEETTSVDKPLRETNVVEKKTTTRRGRKPSTNVQPASTSLAPPLSSNVVPANSVVPAIGLVSGEILKTQEEKKPQRRGRKAGVVTSEQPVSGDHGNDAPPVDLPGAEVPEAQVVKKPQRRGRKGAVADEHQGIDERPVSVEVPHTQEEKKPNRRGRKAVVVADEQSSDHQSNVPSVGLEDSKIQQKQEEMTPQRKDRKGVVVTDEQQPAAPIDLEAAEVPHAQEEKKPIRRGRKAMMVVDDEQPSTSDQQGKDEPQELNVKKPGRRGRNAAGLETAKRETRNIPRHNYDETSNDGVPSKLTTVGRSRHKAEASTPVVMKQVDEVLDLQANLKTMTTTIASPTPSSTVRLNEPVTDATTPRREGRNLPRKNYDENFDEEAFTTTSNRVGRQRKLTAKARQLEDEKAGTPKAVRKEEINATIAETVNTPIKTQATPSRIRGGRKHAVSYEVSEEPISSSPMLSPTNNEPSTSRKVGNGKRKATTQPNQGNEEPPVKLPELQVDATSSSEPAAKRRGRTARKILAGSLQPDQHVAEDHEVELRIAATAESGEENATVNTKTTKRGRGGTRKVEAAETEEGEEHSKKKRVRPLIASAELTSVAKQPEPSTADEVTSTASSSAAPARTQRLRKVHFEAAEDVTSQQESTKRSTRSKR